jgi:hypothetical protein
MATNKPYGDNARTGAVRKRSQRKGPRIPEPSPRAVMWIVATAFALLCGILVFDYATGDPRMSWADAHTAAKPLHFNKAAKS